MQSRDMWKNKKTEVSKRLKVLLMHSIYDDDKIKKRLSWLANVK